LVVADSFQVICRFPTEAVQQKRHGVSSNIESRCEKVQHLPAELSQVDTLREVTFSGAQPLTLRLAANHMRHAACPVQVGILMALEIPIRLALLANATIKSPTLDIEYM